jgi:prepilin-type N-terminal cleavage/methylation domain-containing protein
MNATQKRQRGFSLVELLISVFLLTLMLAAIFSQIEKAQTRYRVEDQKLDLTQQERDFIDQFTRDLHQAGFPTPAMYGNRLDITSARVSAGVWYVSPTDVWMEGDLDDNERVQETRYHYDDGSTWAGSGPNPCPCIRRSSVPKVDGVYPWDPNQATPQYYTEVQNLISVANQPLFQIYDSNGVAVPMSSGSLLLGSGAAVDQVAKKSLQAIKAIRITMTTQSSVGDPDSHRSIQVTMNGTARLTNN